MKPAHSGRASKASCWKEPNVFSSHNRYGPAHHVRGMSYGYFLEELRQICARGDAFEDAGCTYIRRMYMRTWMLLLYTYWTGGWAPRRGGMLWMQPPPPGLCWLWVLHPLVYRSHKSERGYMQLSHFCRTKSYNDTRFSICQNMLHRNQRKDQVSFVFTRHSPLWSLNHTQFVIFKNSQVKSWTVPLWAP